MRPAEHFFLLAANEDHVRADGSQARKLAPPQKSTWFVEGLPLHQNLFVGIFWRLAGCVACYPGEVGVSPQGKQ